MLESDQFGDGSIEFRIAYAYDEEYRLATREMDLDGDVPDGTVETTTYERGPDGRLLALRTVYSDGSTDDRLYAYDYECADRSTGSAALVRAY